MRPTLPHSLTGLLGVLIAFASGLTSLRAAPPYNILFFICEQEQGNLIPAAGYQTPAQLKGKLGKRGFLKFVVARPLQARPLLIPRQLQHPGEP